jgi:uncharacterized protein
LKILISGSSGLLGSALASFLPAHGCDVMRLVRGGSFVSGTIHWDPALGHFPAEELEGMDAVVHLAGENIASRRWTVEQRTRLRDSRIEGTRLLAKTLAALQRPPRVLVCASASGFYGNRADEILTEASSAGTGFLADLCRDWEAAADAARQAGIRTVHLRLGMILSAQGGALARMLTVFKAGLGGRVGSGEQWWSWIAIEDACRVIQQVIQDTHIQGPVNTVAPQPVTNAEFTATLARVLRRPAVLPIPVFLARLGLGEMADALLLASTRLQPAKLLAAGFVFEQPDLESALTRILAR